MSPPLVCCFGAGRSEFVPTVRVSDWQMDADMYLSWNGLQWDPPAFVRGSGGLPSNIAISHARLGGRAAFMGKVGFDDLGNDLVLLMNKETVQSRVVKIHGEVKTAVAYMRIGFEGGKLIAEVKKGNADDSLHKSEISLSVLKELFSGL